MQKGIIHILPLLLITVLIGVGGYYYYQSNFAKVDQKLPVVETQNNSNELSPSPEPTIVEPTATPTLAPVPTKKPVVASPVPTSSEPSKLDCTQFNSSDTTVIKVNLQWIGGFKYEKNWWGWIHTTGDCPGDTKNGKTSIGPINAKDGTLTTPTVGTGQYRININYYDKSGNDGTKGVDVTATSGVTEITVEVQP